MEINCPLFGGDSLTAVAGNIFKTRRLSLGSRKVAICGEARKARRHESDQKER